MVFFDTDSATIDSRATPILDNAAETFRHLGYPPMRIEGHSDRSGSRRYNVALSLRRAEAVRAYLAARGVPPATMATRGLGETHLLVDTPDGVREPQNRRVDILFA